MQRRDFLTDYRILRGLINIYLRPMCIVLRDVCISKNCFHRTLGNARIAIDASVGVDIKTIGKFMKCFDRTDSGTISVLTVNA
jgi:hypothetical protein